MSDRQRELRRRRRRRNRLRRFYAVILAPARLPRISLSLVESLMRVCEVSGMILVVAVMACMINTCGFTTFMVMAAAAVFFGSMFTIWLQGYQTVLRQHGYMN